MSMYGHVDGNLDRIARFAAIYFMWARYGLALDEAKEKVKSMWAAAEA